MPFSPDRRAILCGLAATLTPLRARAEAKAPSRIIEARAAGDALTFDGVSPGPVLRFRQGDELNVKFVNKLDQPATLHWHGLRGDNAMDGVAPLTQAAVAPDESFDYRRKLTEPGLFCYRPSVYGRTPELMRRGLKGLLVVDEKEPLPADHDLLLVLDDQGETGALLVNGKAAPTTQEMAPNARVRLRLANLSGARIMILSFDGTQPFVIAIDGQPCEAFEPVRKSIPVAPGARFELMFDMPKTEGEKARLFLRGAEGAENELVVLTAKGARTEGRGLIYGLPQNPALPAEIKLGNAKKVDLVIEQKKPEAWTINGVATGGYAGAPLFNVKRGTPVTFGFVNKSVVPLAMHVHGHVVRLLHDLDDGWEPYWRNAIIVPGGKTKHVSLIADAPGKWAVHDDILDHEASGLATWFGVD